jgi:hypothetical protein
VVKTAVGKTQETLLDQDAQDSVYRTAEV